MSKLEDTKVIIPIEDKDSLENIVNRKVNEFKETKETYKDKRLIESKEIYENVITQGYKYIEEDYIDLKSIKSKDITETSEEIKLKEVIKTIKLNRYLRRDNVKEDNEIYKINDEYILIKYDNRKINEERRDKEVDDNNKICVKISSMKFKEDNESKEDFILKKIKNTDIKYTTCKEINKNKEYKRLNKINNEIEFIKTMKEYFISRVFHDIFLFLKGSFFYNPYITAAHPRVTIFSLLFSSLLFSSLLFSSLLFYHGYILLLISSELY